MSECKTCGEDDCDKHSFFIGKTIKLEHFSGSTPPEIFVGKWNYPNVYTGILAPQQVGDTTIMSSPEEWHKNKLAISDIIGYRNQLIYGRTQSNIKKLETKFLGVMKEVAMTHKSIATEFHLKKPVTANKEQDDRSPLIPKAAEIERAELQENAPVIPKIDYLVNDTEVKSAIAIQELHKANTQVSTIIKVLSAGLLGLKKNRKLVPTRWSVTCVDSTLSEQKIEKIRYFPQISEYLVFSGEYIGNHYEIILLPRYWSFEVIEISIKNPYNIGIWQDYESIFKRKKYAESVTGGYYSARLGITEYLEQVRKQASVLVLREIHPQYYAPLGVGILREITRSAMKEEPKRFETLQEALNDVQTRLKTPINNYLNKSQMIIDMKQKTLQNFIN